MFLFKKVRLNSTKAKEKKNETLSLKYYEIVILTQEAANFFFVLFRNSCTMFGDFSSSFFPGHFLRPLERKTGSEGFFLFFFHFGFHTRHSFELNYLYGN